MKNYFTIKELCQSNTAIKYGIDNTPSKEVERHLKEMITFLNPLREAWGSAIWVTSGYRCPTLNRVVGGVSSSMHLKGYAVDLYPANGKFTEFKKFIREYLKDESWDQCIIERSGTSQWIHLGLYSNARLQRKQIFNLNV